MSSFSTFAIAFILAIVCGMAVQAQESTVPAILGQVVDAESGEVLPSASVAVWKLPRTTAGDTTLATGAITDDNGRFHIDGLRRGQYRLIISYVGYDSQPVEEIELARGAPDIDLGVIELNPDYAAFDNVDVVAERERVEYQIDRTVYRTADDPLSQTGTATTVLENIPSVDVDIDGNVSLRGVSNVAILINGRPAPVSGAFITSYLQSLPAATINRVEVIPNPSARYEPDGMAGILNIVLEEDVELGIGGALTAGGDSRGGINATGLLTYNKGALTVTSSYGFRRSDRDTDGTRFRINRFLDPLTTLDQDLLNGRTSNSHFGSVTADYGLSQQSLLTVSGQVGIRGNDSESTTTFLERDAGDTVLSDYSRVGIRSGDNWNASGRVGFRHDFGTPSSAEERGASRGRGGFRGGRGRGSSRGARTGLGSHTLNVEARYRTSSGDDMDLFSEESARGGVVGLQQTMDDDFDTEFSFQADYVRPMAAINADSRLEIGYRGEVEDSESAFFSETFDYNLDTYVPDVDLNNAFDYNQQIHALYGQFATKVGSVSVQLGLRAETASTTFTLQNTGEDFDNGYTSVFPSAFVLYEVGENTAVRSSYSRRINRPRTRYLNPFPSVSDPLNIQQGNPALLPEYIDAMELGFIHYTGFGSLTLSPYYRRTTDVIRRFQDVGEDGVTTNTYQNLDTNESYGVELIASFRSESLRGSASVEGYKVVTDGSNVDADLENNSFAWGGRANLNYSVMPGLDVQGSVRYSAGRDTEQGSIGARAFINFGARQRFLEDRATISLSVRDPFEMGKMQSILDQPALYQEFERSFGGRQVNVSFTYAFGQRDQQRRPQQRPEMEGGGDEISLDG